jgi:glutathione S-transferase
MLQEAGLEYEVRPVQSRTGETQTEEFRRLNPREKIPVLQHGDLVLAESAAIVSYLAGTFGVERGLIPRAGSRERALYDQWCFFVMTELDAHTLYVLRRHVDLAALYGEAPNAVSAARAYFQKQVAVAGAELADGRSFLLGETFSGADILLGSCLDWAVFYGEPLSAGLEAYRIRLGARDAYRRAYAANFPPEVMQALLEQRREPTSAG